MKYIFKCIGILLPIAAVVMIVLQVVVSNELATLGKKLGQLDQNVKLESDINEALRTEVASASSLLVLRDRAELLGFVEPTSKQVISLTSEIPVALKHSDTSIRPSFE